MQNFIIREGEENACLSQVVDIPLTLMLENEEGIVLVGKALLQRDFCLSHRFAEYTTLQIAVEAIVRTAIVEVAAGSSVFPGSSLRRVNRLAVQDGFFLCFHTLLDFKVDVFGELQAVQLVSSSKPAENHLLNHSLLGGKFVGT